MRGPAGSAPVAPDVAPRLATGARRAWGACVTAARLLVGVPAAAAQITGTVDIGVSTVRYDGFLPSGAAAVTPALRWDRPAGTVTASGTYLRFESGHRSLQGLLAGSLFTPPTPRPWRGELAVSAGASRYIDFASFWHAVAEARLHIPGAERGAWISAAVGRTSYGAAPRPVVAAGIGTWVRLPGLTLKLTANHSQVGDTTYTDLESSARAAPGSVALEATLGTRVWSQGGGRGVFGEASAAVWVRGRTALVLSGGRYATDAISGTIAGRYLTASVRLRTSAPRRLTIRDATALPHRGADGGSALPAVRMEVHADRGGLVRLVVHAPGATHVELAGDFTDWQPLALVGRGNGVWESVLQIPSGLHRVNVRIDGAGWVAPAGITWAADEYGSEVGIFAVP